MKYEFRAHGPNPAADISAEVVAAELNRIEEETGNADRRSIVEAARPDDAVLHPAFEWDDAVAAERYREAQAGQIVRAVVLVPEPEKGESLPIVRAFVSMPREDNPRFRSYRPIQAVLQDPAAAERFKSRLRNDLLMLRQRYLNVLELDEALSQQFNAMLTATGTGP